MSKWVKCGKRCLTAGNRMYQAVIFGAPAPKTMWAWAVWSKDRKVSGVEGSFKDARVNASAEIWWIEGKEDS